MVSLAYRKYLIWCKQKSYIDTEGSCDKICRFFARNSSCHNAWTVYSNWMQFSQKEHLRCSALSTLGTKCLSARGVSNLVVQTLAFTSFKAYLVLFCSYNRPWAPLDFCRNHTVNSTGDLKFKLIAATHIVLCLRFPLQYEPAFNRTSLTLHFN